MEEEGGIIIFDTGGGRNGTATRRAWHVFDYKNHKYILLGQQDKSEGKVYPVVNDVMKAWIQGRDLPVLLVMNYATLLDDPNEIESLAFPFQMMEHGATVDMKPRNLDGDGGLYVDEEYLPFWWDNEKLYYSIEKHAE